MLTLLLELLDLHVAHSKAGRAGMQNMCRWPDTYVPASLAVETLNRSVRLCTHIASADAAQFNPLSKKLSPAKGTSSRQARKRYSNSLCSTLCNYTTIEARGRGSLSYCKASRRRTYITPLGGSSDFTTGAKQRNLRATYRSNCVASGLKFSKLYHGRTSR